VVLECIVPEVAERVTAALAVPTIGIGCGPTCDGQIIVVHDILGMLPGEAPQFVKRYAQLFETASQAVAAYAADVKAGRFPATIKPKDGERSKIYGRGA